MGADITRMPRSRSALFAVLVLLLLAVLVVAGCGEEEGAAAEESFDERLIEAEQEGSEISAEPASFISLCANCHDRLDRELDWRRERKLIFNHPAHFANGIRCQACHQEFPHKPGRTIHVSVETCFTCHGTVHGQNGVLASTDCDTCHTPDIEPVTTDHAFSNWLIAEGAEVALHSQRAAEERLYCKMCHEETYCRDCHQIDMPHPEDWQVSHRPSAAEGTSSCDQCHEPNYCNTCHHSEFEQLADWRNDHRSVVGGVGATPCYECHQEVFCADCHVRTGRERGVLGG